MISTFSIYLISAIISPLFYRKEFFKLFALAVTVIAFCFSDRAIGLSGFETNQAITLFVQILSAVIFAFIVHQKDEHLITQALFLSASAVALLQSSTLVTFIISFEALSLISVIITLGFNDTVQARGAIRIFIAGAVATAIIMIGAVLLLFSGADLTAPLPKESNILTISGVLIIFAALFYKMTIFPMHSWAASTYADITPDRAALLSGVAKSVSVLAIFKFFAPYLANLSQDILLSIAILAIITMTLGNFMALFRERLSTILAYSSIAHSGYMLLAFAFVGSKYASSGILYMAVAYIFMQTASFLILDILKKRHNIETLTDIRGLGSYSPVLSLFFTVQLLSLAGIPMLAGFMGKAILFYAGIDAGMVIVVLIALLNSALSVAYYAWIIKHIYFDKAQKSESLYLDKSIILSQSILLTGTVMYGIYVYKILNVGMFLLN